MIRHVISNRVTQTPERKPVTILIVGFRNKACLTAKEMSADAACQIIFFIPIFLCCAPIRSKNFIFRNICAPRHCLLTSEFIYIICNVVWERLVQHDNRTPTNRRLHIDDLIPIVVSRVGN